MQTHFASANESYGDFTKKSLNASKMVSDENCSIEISMVENVDKGNYSPPPFYGTWY